ncbi:hypothetical protein OY671_011857, partial [Metschnikowia pulcherrima]
LVPREAVIRTGARNLVILARADGRYRPAEVRLGREGGGRTEILTGLAPDEKVAASGQCAMIAAIIRGSVRWRNSVLVVAAVSSVLGFYAVRTTPVDALPDLSDVQVIIRTNYPGPAPQIVENQVTYPLASTSLSVPGAR